MPRTTASALLLLCVLWPATGFAAQWMQLTLPDGAAAPTEVMLTPRERALGLMYRDALPAGQLMLFHYNEDGKRELWMKNCRFAIDAAWLDADGKVLAVMPDLPPCEKEPCPIYGPDVSARYMVEGTAGWADEYGVTVGAVIGLGERTNVPPK